MTATIGDPVYYIESKFGVQLRRVGRTEWAGPCPWCGGQDRFRMWERGNYWCRPGPGHCGRAGWLDELDSDSKPLTPQELTDLRLAALERQVADHEQRLSALEVMHACTDHLTYHANLDSHAAAVDYWLSEGMTVQTIMDRQLGYCPDCPTARGHDSYTIPVICGEKLYNIRHRLCTPPERGGKYRPHMAGLPSMLFNADDLTAETDSLLVLEGEKKSLVVSQETGLANVATMGATSFKPEWAGKLRRFGTVNVCYDPDAREKALAVARLFQGRGRLVSLPVKADDYFVRYGGTAAQFAHYLRTARPV
jgi:hypothetical protein